MNTKFNVLSIRHYAFLFSFLLTITQSTEAEEDFLSVYGDADLISIATGSETPISKAPSVATVITEEDIWRTGASDLDDVLEMTPGLHVSRSHVGFAPIYSIRGIFTERNQHVLLLINGIPMTSVHFGNRNNTWGGMPVHNIKRVEIIRGPGSALYGADAFSGVINVVTKKHDDIVDQVGTRVGSFDSQQLWMLKKGSLGELKSAFSAEVAQTDGHKELIKSDMFGARGNTQTEKEMADIHWDLTYGGWNLHLGYQGRYNLGTGAGVGTTLDEFGEFNGHRAMADLNYAYTSPEDIWEFTSQLSYVDMEDSSFVMILPPGGPFPFGALASPEVFERHYRFNFGIVYQGFANHRLRFGGGVQIDDMHKIREKKNFDAALAPLASFQDVQNVPSLVFIKPGSRRVYFFFMQDEWALAQNWDLTAGVRFDFYSDFGRTVNPRLALVWNPTDKLTVKGLFGRAFRAPSFSEQRIQNNPILQGDSSLDPETIATTELAFHYQISEKLDSSLNIYRYKMKDLLRFVLDPGVGKQVAQNTDEQKGYGLESEVHWQAMSDLDIYFNYAFQDSRDEATKEDAGNAPHHQVYVSADWNVWDKLYLNTQFNWILNREREPSQKRRREKIKDYSTLDFNVHYGTEEDQFRVSLGVKNIFDKIGREPTIPAAVMVKDIPIPGRSVFLEAALNLD